jgi:TRAP-type C4-dicarboxylate transport system substrate-binding protein
MTPAIIALLLSLNLITSAAEWDTLSDAEQQELREIVTEDINKY